VPFATKEELYSYLVFILQIAFMIQEAYIFDAVRTPRGRGKKTGALHEVKPIDLIATVLDALRKRNGLDTSKIDDVILGCVSPIGEQGGNIAKAAALYLDWDEQVPGLQINRLCASALEAINLGATKIRSGWEHLIVAGGVESMSRVPMGSDGGALLFDPAVNAKVGYIPQGVSADLIATMEGYSREELDAFALQSIQRATNALQSGYFDNSIVPVYDMNGLEILMSEEFLRQDSTLEKLSALNPSFAYYGSLGFDDVALIKYPYYDSVKHLHTAGNSSGIADGAAAVLLGNQTVADELGLTPRAKIRAAAVSSGEPTVMLLGSIPATEKALKIAGLTADDIELWEVNEAFAAPVLKFKNHFNISDEKMNVNGGVIALGHPLGATGAILIGTLLDELERQDKSIGMVTMCMADGMGVATIIERI
jgi:acetyl-CoA C-acetyltransferase